MHDRTLSVSGRRTTPISQIPDRLRTPRVHRAGALSPALPVLMIALIGTLLGAGTATPARAAEMPAAHGAPAAAQGAGGDMSGSATEPRSFVTHHTLELGGQTLGYQAVAGETFLRDADGKPEASVFSIAYFLDGNDGKAGQRPITFLFNGGPGSTATWLHLGAFGPERLVLEDGRNPGAPPYTLGPNPYTLLPSTDMVFVDPIGTGYSHALGEHKDSDYWGVDTDASSLARFIRDYLTAHKRWASPKYLAGESYGTTRCAMLVGALQLDPLNSTALNGVILLSSALDVQAFMENPPGNDLIYVALLPTYTAIARYHDKIPADPDGLDALLDSSRTFASGDYLTALFAGDTLSDEQRQQIAAKLHSFTGLSEDYLLRSNLRVPYEHFAKELLRDQGKVLGIHDGRYLGKDPDDAGASVEWDPFVLSIAGPFATVMNDYLTGELGADFGRPYQVFNLGIPATWKRPQGERWTDGYLNVVDNLSAAAATNKDFHVFVAAGIHDLVTSFFGAEYTFNHSGIPKDQLTVQDYFGGHMMYLHDDSLEKLSTDIRQMIDGR